MQQYLRNSIVGLLVILGLAACASQPGKSPRDPARRPAASDIPRVEPVIARETISEHGNPAAYMVDGKIFHTSRQAIDHTEEGLASWYGEQFHGRLTSNQEVFDMYGYSAAHKTLPLPSIARITHLENGKTVLVRVNDRGPFVDGRVLDLSYAAARKLDMINQGVAPVRVEVLAAPFADADPQNPLFVLQIGAFADLVRATGLKDSLTRNGISPAYTEPVKVGDQELHRVRAGPYSELKHADEALNSLKALGFENARLLVE